MSDPRILDLEARVLEARELRKALASKKEEEEKVRYFVISNNVALKRGYPQADCLNDGWSLWRTRSTSEEPNFSDVEYVAEDGGEPEDQSLVRDWDWVPVRLEEAYRLGFADGKASQ